jgi:hypothetical protein
MSPEAANATALGAAGIGIPGVMWATDKLGYQAPHWAVELALIVSVLFILVSIVLWAHLLWRRIRGSINWFGPERQIQKVVPNTFAEDIPDLRVADSDLVMALFESSERDKLLPLLEAERLRSWARPMRGNEPGKDPPPVILKGETWRNNYLQFFPKREGQYRAQTFLKTKSRHESSYFDVVLNKIQVERIWPEQIPFVEAARRVYEAAEAANVLEFVVQNTEAADKKLSHLKLLLMVDEKVELFGIRPPSTKARLISKTELRDDLYPAEGDLNQINHHISDEPIFLNVTVRHATLIPAIGRYITDAKGHGK